METTIEGSAPGQVLSKEDDRGDEREVEQGYTRARLHDLRQPCTFPKLVQALRQSQRKIIGPQKNSRGGTECSRDSRAARVHRRRRRKYADPTTKIFSALWCFGSRRVNGYAEDSWRGFGRSDWSSRTSSSNNKPTLTSLDE